MADIPADALTPAEVIASTLRHLMGDQRATPVRVEQARAILSALAEQGMVVVSAEDYRYVLDRAEQFAMHRFDADDSVLVVRLRAALPERTETP